MKPQRCGVRRSQQRLHAQGRHPQHHDATACACPTNRTPNVGARQSRGSRPTGAQHAPTSPCSAALSWYCRICKAPSVAAPGHKRHGSRAHTSSSRDARMALGATSSSKLRRAHTQHEQDHAWTRSARTRHKYKSNQIHSSSTHTGSDPQPAARCADKPHVTRALELVAASMPPGSARRQANERTHKHTNTQQNLYFYRDKKNGRTHRSRATRGGTCCAPFTVRTPHNRFPRTHRHSQRSNCGVRCAQA